MSGNPPEQGILNIFKGYQPTQASRIHGLQLIAYIGIFLGPFASNRPFSTDRVARLYEGAQAYFARLKQFLFILQTRTEPCFPNHE